MSKMLESALSYANSGLRVFPLVPNAKTPFIKDWGNQATSNIEKIKKWWNDNPNCNIGIATGQNLHVIDIDVKNDKNGLKALEEWTEHHNYTIPITATVRTPTNGLHFYYFVNGEYRNQTNILTGIDARGEGGYVVAPPSIIDDQEYRWANSEPIRDANEVIYELIHLKENKQFKPLVMNEEIESGTRNDTLFKLACSLQSKGLSDNAILNAVWQENNDKCNPPLEKEEVKRICSSAITYSKGDNNYKELAKNLDLDIVSMDEIDEKEAQWLIYNYIPKGAITIVGADGGVGKTFFWCDLVAAVSSGRSTFFENENYTVLSKKEPQKVMFFSSEDDASITLKKRLRLNNANMSNIITIPIEDERFKEIKYNSRFLEELIKEYRPALLVFDPLQGFLPHNVNMGQRNHMRETLAPLIGYGGKYGVTTVIVCHTNKKSDVDARAKLGDSSDIWDIARSVFLMGYTDVDNIRYLSHEKCNYGPLQETTLFTIDDGVLTNKGSTDKKFRDFSIKKSYERKNKGAKDEAKEFIIEQLKENDGSMENKELLEYAQACGFSKISIERGKNELKNEKIITIETTGFGKERKSILKLLHKERF